MQAVVSCVPVRDVNRVIDEKILSDSLYKMGRDRPRLFNADGCAFISFYFQTANQLTSEERMRTISVLSARLSQRSGSPLENKWILHDGF